MITIKVFRQMGHTPVSGKKVAVFTSTGEKTQYTNDNGAVNFDLPGGKDYKVYVDGRKVYEGRVVGVEIVYI